MILPPNTDAAIMDIHRFVGYPLAFVVAPIALASFAGKPGHRWAGRAYMILMTFLYVSGTILTVTRHEWATWDFARNVAFNLFGYTLALLGFRAMWLWSRTDIPRPALLDRALLGLVITLAATLAALAAFRSGPIAGIALVAIVLAGLEVRDWRAGFTPAVLYRRHVRCIIASYFYVLTVVSLVHLRDELSSDLRWLWPSAVGAAVLFLAGGPAFESLRPSRAAARAWAIRVTIAVALVFGSYAVWEAVNGRGVNAPAARMSGPAE